MSVYQAIPSSINIGQDDNEPIEFYVEDQSGTVFDLTGKTVIFSMAKDGATARKAGGSCDLNVDPATGRCTFAWGSGDTDTAGTYWGQLKITTTSGGKIIRSRKFIIEIEDKVPEA